VIYALSVVQSTVDETGTAQTSGATDHHAANKCRPSSNTNPHIEAATAAHSRRATDMILIDRGVPGVAAVTWLPSPRLARTNWSRDPRNALSRWLSPYQPVRGMYANAYLFRSAHVKSARAIGNGC
jgi:hypothetical protein